MASLCDDARATLDPTGQPSNAAATKGTARDLSPVAKMTSAPSVVRLKFL
jgi:hypothetical protein